MKNQNKKWLLIILSLALMLLIGGCANSSNKGNNQVSEGPTTDPNLIIEGQKNPIVTIEMENGKKIQMELYPKIAPNTVNNFISLIQSGFYNGVIFHRIVPDFVIQGGDPTGTGAYGPGYTIKGEFTANGFDNPLKHTRGVVSMARTMEPDTAGSQFFIVLADAENLDGEYAAFGKVISGMDEVDRIAAVETRNEKPIEEQRMKKVTVDTFGVNYPEPEVIE